MSDHVRRDEATSAVAPPLVAAGPVRPPQPTKGFVPPEKRLCDDPFQGKLELVDDSPLYGSAIVGGLVSAIVGGVLWTFFAKATHQKIAVMALVVGILVGVGIQLIGDGAKRQYGLIGALIAIVGCALGNLLAGCGLLAHELGRSYADVLLNVGLVEPMAVLEKMHSPPDVIFYVVAVFTAYALARGRAKSK